MRDHHIYLIQPTYRNARGALFKGQQLSYCSLALPALSAVIPDDWQKSFCIEYYDEVDYETTARVIGISSMGYDLLHGMEIAREFKRRGKTVLFGGPQASISSERLRTVCDIVVHGCPGRREMQTILEDITRGRHQREYETGYHINVPFDYSVLNNKAMKFMPALTSVGCRDCCDFCCTAALMKGQYRLRSIEYVLAELRSIRQRTRDVVFGDANLFNNREYLFRLCQRIIDADLNLRWGAQCTVDIGDDEELLRLLRTSGCMMLLVGLETLNEENLLQCHKRYQASLHRDRLARIRDAGIEVGGYFVLGLDSDTVESFDNLFDFIHQTRIALPILNLLIPAPGTPISEQLQREGRLLIHNEEEFLSTNARYANSCSRCYYVPKHMTVEEAERGFLQLYGRLTSYPEIFRRSLRVNLSTTAALFMMNLEMRSEYRAMTGLDRRDHLQHQHPE